MYYIIYFASKKLKPFKYNLYKTTAYLIGFCGCSLL